MHNYKNNLFLSCVLKFFAEMPNSSDLSGMSAPNSKSLKRQYGFSNLTIIAALLTLCVIISGIIVIMNRGPEISQEDPAKTDPVEVARDVSPAPQMKAEDAVAIDSQSSPKPPDGSKDYYLDAEKATEEGDIASARELTSKAFEEELRMAIERRVTGDSTGKMGDEEKKQFLSALKKMWSSHERISQVESSISGTVEAMVAPEPSDDPVEPKDPPDSLLPLRSDPECGDGICEGSETNATCPSDCAPPLPPATCCGGYTLDELNAMYYEDEGSFWPLIWACNDLEACF